MIDTDTGWPQQGGRLRIVWFRCALVAGVGLWAGAAMAEEGGAQVFGERRLVLARASADHSATIYGAPGKPLLLLFDSPLG